MTKLMRTCWVVVAIVVLLGLNAWGTAADEAYITEQAEREADRAASYEAGRQVGKEEALAALAPAALPRGGCAQLGLVGVNRKP